MGEQKFITNEYAMYGLNKYRSFLEAPMCDCGCGEKMLLQIKQQEELFAFCQEELEDYDIDNCAIFIVKKNGELLIAYHESNKNKGIKIHGIKTPDMRFFAIFDAEKRLDSYSLLIEEEEGGYRIVEAPE